MKTWSCLGVLLLAATTAAADTAKPKNTVQVLMHEKLASAQGLLEGLALEDYGIMEKNATRLKEISQATEWHRKEDPEFQHYAKNFQNSASFLVDEAKKHNLEGVAMGYVRVVLDCMQCHNFVRAGRPRN